MNILDYIRYKSKTYIVMSYCMATFSYTFIDAQRKILEVSDLDIEIHGYEEATDQDEKEFLLTKYPELRDSGEIQETK